MSRATVSRIWRRPTACSAALALASAILSRRSDVSSAPSNSSPVRGLRVTSTAGPFRRTVRKSNTSTPLRRYVISTGPATDSTRPNRPPRAASAGDPNAYNAGMAATSLKELGGCARVRGLYDEDFWGWTQEQAGALKRRDPGAIDWDNVIEEVETLGRSEKSFWASHRERYLAPSEDRAQRGRQARRRARHDRQADGDRQGAARFDAEGSGDTKGGLLRCDTPTHAGSSGTKGTST